MPHVILFDSEMETPDIFDLNDFAVVIVDERELSEELEKVGRSYEDEDLVDVVHELLLDYPYWDDPDIIIEWGRLPVRWVVEQLTGQED